MDWVIDTDVLARADDGDELHDHCFNVLQLLGTIKMSGHMIAMDSEGRIAGEYQRNLNSSGMVGFAPKQRPDSKVVKLNHNSDLNQK